MTRFQISVGQYRGDFGFHLDLNVLQVDSVTINRTRSLLGKCDRLLLRRVRDLKCIMFQQLGENTETGFPCKCFSQLKTLKIKMMSSLTEIWHGPCSSCFANNLTEIEICKCSKLKRVFPLSMAAELTQLQSMKISECPEMEQIF